MSKINCLPDKRSVEINKSDTVLEALLLNGIEHTHVCGGNAYCSTCRIMILDGVQNCSPPTSAERALAKKLDFPVHVRLACQTKVTGDVSIRRMVIDNEDIDILEGQLATGAVNSDRNVALLVATIRGSTNFDEVNFHYDIVYIMSRYFHRVQKVVGQYGGIIPNVMGVRVMAVFGFEKNSSQAAERAVWAGLELLKTIAELNVFLKKLSYNPLNMSIGIHYGAAVLIPIDPSKLNVLTPLGDIVNSVGRIEAANQEVGSDLLISESVYNQVKDKAIINRNGNFSLGKNEFKVYEVTGMQGNPPKVAKVQESTAPAPKRFMSFLQKFLSK
ncbi:adenylate cyclase [Pseudanabaena sp. lw0831]|uniref:adenylate/guanylate cyclase domain-containing protein n=1 Tax=Pseudanabaena sp. lw0831 TaxID=1357935 RepID=UPI00191565C8|nr:adenylate/guanylate cyclase domain-containing protein [Pseudanabaena sp. lw0831]GBO55415.1 adenylate cyclase [Pseudanabaena sp. lw0831]